MKISTCIKTASLVLLVFLLNACKHKQKQTTAKAPVKKNTHVAKQKTESSKKTEAKTPLQQKLGLSSKEVKHSEFYTFVDNWYGAPYKYGGCKQTGVDCSCFVNLLYEKVYGKKIGRTTSEMFEVCDKISLEDAAEGDLLFFKIQGNKISHVGIYLRNKMFVHASTSKGVIINSLDEAYYKKFFFCAGKLKNV